MTEETVHDLQGQYHNMSKLVTIDLVGLSD